MFNLFPKTDIDIVAPDGTVRHRTKAILDANNATIEDTTLTVEIGDEIRRRLPNGKEETFEVLDPIYQEKFHAIPEHYAVLIRKKGTYARGREGHYSIRINGPNSRVNIHSNDRSYNAANEGSIFEKMIDAVATSQAAEADKTALISLIAELQMSQGDKNAFLTTYQRFITSAANHMTVIAPFLPAITNMMS